MAILPTATPTAFAHPNCNSDPNADADTNTDAHPDRAPRAVRRTSLHAHPPGRE
ncbi:MAG: hypothetical protein M0C28_28910 [Candidatus Moduliflexus flocculans]|nr:hypothetical protein [Candidatus Moduliflexus flocculans]